VVDSIIRAKEEDRQRERTQTLFRDIVHKFELCVPGTSVESRVEIVAAVATVLCTVEERPKGTIGPVGEMSKVADSMTTRMPTFSSRNIMIESPKWSDQVVRRLKDLTIDIGNEVKEQNSLLDQRGRCFHEYPRHGCKAPFNELAPRFVVLVMIFLYGVLTFKGQTGASCRVCTLVLVGQL
jgi:hypothetical protein